MLEAGEVGFIIAGIKDIFGAPVGDTITLATTPDVATLPGFKKVKPQVYAGLFPIDSSDFEPFREALHKLQINDSALFFERKFRCLRFWFPLWLPWYVAHGNRTGASRA